ncbi:hypothetical protein [Collinsella sp. Sow4_E3]|uniref:hypothetical protein n=1 Tax=Collinsella sp. Sow4_E3 TaxID=3438776 RepID=UPI003F8F3519
MTQDALIDVNPETGPRKRRGFVGPHVAQWLADQTRHIQAERCRRCRADVLRGLDDMWAAGPIEVDPTPLSALGEALALLAGRRTIACEHWHGLRFTRRGRWQITSRPAGTFRGDVYASHLCGAPALPSIPSNFAKPVVDDDLPGAPPPF